jgi:membrane-associated PAP2 superfamily phosphatase
MTPQKRCRYYWILPLALLLFGTVAIVWSGADIAIAKYFFRKGPAHWPVGDLLPFAFAYRCGEIIGWLPGVFGLAVLVAGFWIGRLAKWRIAALFLVASLALGPGLIVNGILKENWQRPRPRQVEQFGGDYQFQQPLVIGPKLGSCRSFPSGHAAMGFIFISPYFILLAKHRKAALFWLYGGTAYGIFIGAARVAQGAHWLSDVLWAFGIVYFTCYALARIMHLDRMDTDDQPA